MPDSETDEVSPEIKNNRTRFLDALVAIISDKIARYPERFAEFLMKLETPKESIALSIATTYYTPKLGSRDVVFLDDFLLETCIHCEIEPTLSALFDFIGAISEDEANALAERRAHAEKVVQNLANVLKRDGASERLVKVLSSELQNLKKVVTDAGG